MKYETRISLLSLHNNIFIIKYNYVLVRSFRSEEIFLVQFNSLFVNNTEFKSLKIQISGFLKTTYYGYFYDIEEIGSGKFS